MDKATREWLRELRSMEPPEAEEAIRKRVSMDGHWGPALLAIQHTILPRGRMIELANEIMADSRFTNSRPYLILAQRLGMERFLSMPAANIPDDRFNKGLMSHNLLGILRDLSSDDARGELQRFLDSNF